MKGGEVKLVSKSADGPSPKVFEGGGEPVEPGFRTSEKVDQGEGGATEGANEGADDRVIPVNNRRPRHVELNMIGEESKEKDINGYNP